MNSLDSLLGQLVVLDTAGPIVYLGRLASFDDAGFWLEEADMHNVSEGHATREQYIAEAGRDGVHVNRHCVFVFRHSVISMSALTQIVKE